jgi:DamX protein
MQLNNQANNSSSLSYLLITKERTQKLDLLNHLIDNLAHAITICGPEGIGKTFLVHRFQESAPDSAIVCAINAQQNIGFETIQTKLIEVIKSQLPDFHFNSLYQALDRLRDRDYKVVLVIDDAGLLEPGLIDQIITYAEEKPVLRVVVVLTHNELYLKNTTDPKIENSYQIEIPALNEQQCTEYLEYLATFARPRIQFAEINEGMVAVLYRETHGIPGNILARLPDSKSFTVKDNSKTILGFAVLVLIMTALGIQWWSTSPKTSEKVSASADKANRIVPRQQADDKVNVANNKQTNVTPIQKYPVDTNQVGQTNEHAETMPKEITEPVVSETKNTGSIVPDENVNLMQGTDIAEEETGNYENPADAEAGGVADSNDWVKSQPITNYTLQLMALSNQEAIIEVLSRHQGELGTQLRYLKTKSKNGRDRFVLLYGSFASPEQAGAEKEKLPKELQKTWLRRLDAVQEEVNRINQEKLPG